MAESHAKTRLSNAEIGDKIKRLRSFRGLTCAELAETIGCTRPYLSAVENGRYPVSTKILKKLTKTLNVNPDYFVAPGEPDIQDTTYYTRDRLANMPEAIAQAAQGAASTSPSVQSPFSAGGTGLAHAPTASVSSPGATRRIPFVALSPTGKTNVHFDEIPHGDTDTIDCPGDVTDSRAFAIRIDGDEMTPILPVGAMAVVAPNLKLREGRPVVARLSNGETICRLYYAKRDQVILVPNNRQSQVSVFDAASIDWIYPVVKVIVDTYNDPPR